MYLELNAKMLDVSLKNGSIKLQAELPKGAADILADMIGRNLEITFEIKQVVFAVSHSKKTNEPIRKYRVESSGVVSEIKDPPGEQTEMELGVPKPPEPTVEKDVEIERDIIDAFIAEGLSPRYDDLSIDFHSIIKRRINGESYRAMAKENGLSDDVLVEMLTEYRKRVAPLAQKWHDWKTGKIEAVEPTPQESEKGADETQELTEGETTSEGTEAVETDSTSVQAEDVSGDGENVPEKESEDSTDKGTDSF